MLSIITAVLTLCFLAGIALLGWWLVEVHRDHNQVVQRHQQREQLRIHYEAQLLARQLQAQANRVQADMLRAAMQHMDQPPRPRQDWGGRHG